MAARLISSVLAVLICLLTGVAILLFLLLAMNGYSEADATWGLAAYIILAFLTAVLIGFAAYYSTNYLLRRTMNAALAAILPAGVLVVLGAGMQVISGLIAVGIAEFARVNW